MTGPIDLRPATTRLGALVAAVTDDQLDAPTPCEDYVVGDLVDHVRRFAGAFTALGRREGFTPGGPGSAASLPDGWRGSIPAGLDALADAWAAPGAWDGELSLGFELPARMVGLISLDESTIHGWDLARSIGQPFTPDEADLRELEWLLTEAEAPGGKRIRDIGFGASFEVPADAPRLDRVLALAGRDPSWTP